MLVGEEPVIVNEGRESTTLRVVNAGDRPVQVGSHYHFAVANTRAALRPRRGLGQAPRHRRGTAVRFEPGVAREVSLVPLAGARIVPGLAIGGEEALDAR